MDYEAATDEQSMLEDLQLAAELGKTLLERNKELETSLKQHQNIIEDQTQEIEYLTKQTAALREVNDSRLRIYEQLEVGIQDLERTNQRLTLENAADKKHIKSLSLTIETIEGKCEELQRSLDEISIQKENRMSFKENNMIVNHHENISVYDAQLKNIKYEGKLKDSGVPLNTETDGMVQLLEQICELKHQRTKEKCKVVDLEEQLAAVLQENISLEEKLNIMQQKEDDIKSLQEEMLTLEEVRQGQLCRRCLRSIDTRGQDELSLVMDRDDDDISVINSVTSEVNSNVDVLQLQNMEENYNPYRILVEKYEALLEMQRHPVSRQHSTSTSNNCLSLQEELQLSGEFDSFTGKDQESEAEIENIENNKADINQKGRKTKRNTTVDKPFSSTTPTDFSEAETSSSGFSDETSNKGTQTEGHLLPPGSFLCSIADGDDCRFSIYDDASPIESRFRKTPEYRQLFREIFAVLKRAAEAKDEGEQLPLLEDSTPISEVPKVPPATPAKEDQPSNFTTDSKSQENSGKRQVSGAENNKIHNPICKYSESPQSSKSSHNQTDSELQIKIESEESNSEIEEQVKSAPKRDYLEDLSIGIGAKKKSSGRKNSPMKNLKASMQKRVERLEHLNSLGIGMSFSSHSKKRKDFRNENHSHLSSSVSICSASSRDDGGRSHDTCSDNSWKLQAYASTASQEVAKLKQLEKSYAEVLRLGPQKTSRLHNRK